MFWVIIALFAFLKCKCEKTVHFQTFCKKQKVIFFANIYHSPCDSYWNSKKSLKLKPPTVHVNAHLHEDSDAKESSSLFLDGDRCECNGCRHSGRGGHVARTQEQVREYIGSWRTNQGFFYLEELATLMEMERTQRKLRVWVVQHSIRRIEGENTVSLALVITAVLE